VKVALFGRSIFYFFEEKKARHIVNLASFFDEEKIKKTKSKSANFARAQYIIRKYSKSRWKLRNN
jgi:hypothetical protein